MRHRSISKCVTALLLSNASWPVLAQAVSSSVSQSAHQSLENETGLQDIIVTAQKRSESANSVPISITALSGETLAKQGISDVSDLVRVVPGFNYTKGSYGTPVYTLRGIGFYDVSLGATPTVSVYVDEVPLPFSIMTRGATLDLERVEVLKGPQGTLFGQNSTGGAINYIAAKPTRDFHSGGDVSFGRFNTLEAQAYVSGPISDTVSARISVRTEQGGDWQKSYTRDAELGQVGRTYARLILEAHPSEKLRLTINANGWMDKSDTQAGQLVFVNGNPARTPAGVKNYALAPANARAAEWDAVPDLDRDDKFYQISARGEYELADDVRLTAISAYQHFSLDASTDADGTSFQDYRGTQKGNIGSFYNEARLSGDSGHVKWVVGGSYQHDKTNDSLEAGAAQSSFPFTSNRAINQQRISTYAGFANVDYEVLSGLTVQGGIRYTDQRRAFSGCLADTGDGSFATFQGAIATAANGRPIVIAPGACATLDASTLPITVHNRLDQNNVSWRSGLSWMPHRGLLFYANASRGYKSGSFPTLGASRSVQLRPVVQESILAYEVGFKATLLDRTVQFNGAAFYYDYSDKQIRGRLVDPQLGPLNALVNIPASRIQGFEAQINWAPTPALRINTGLTYVDSRIGGGFTNFTQFGALQSFDGEPFPLTPKWQASGDAEYTIPLTDKRSVFLAAGATYQSKTSAAFGEIPILSIKDYALVDLRAGVEAKDGSWRLAAWVKNVGNTFYWNNVVTVIDTTIRYTGMPRTFGATLNLRY